MYKYLMGAIMKRLSNYRATHNFFKSAPIGLSKELRAGCGSVFFFRNCREFVKGCFSVFLGNCHAKTYHFNDSKRNYKIHEILNVPILLLIFPLELLLPRTTFAPEHLKPFPSFLPC